MSHLHSPPARRALTCSSSVSRITSHSSSPSSARLMLAGVWQRLQASCEKQQQGAGHVREEIKAGDGVGAAAWGRRRARLQGAKVFYKSSRRPRIYVGGMLCFAGLTNPAGRAQRRTSTTKGAGQSILGPNSCHRHVVGMLRCSRGVPRACVRVVGSSQFEACWVGLSEARQQRAIETRQMLGGESSVGCTHRYRRSRNPQVGGWLWPLSQATNSTSRERTASNNPYETSSSSKYILWVPKNPPPFVLVYLATRGEPHDE